MGERLQDGGGSRRLLNCFEDLPYALVRGCRRSKLSPARRYSWVTPLESNEMATRIDDRYRKSKAAMLCLGAGARDE